MRKFNVIVHHCYRIAKNIIDLNHIVIYKKPNSDEGKFNIVLKRTAVKTELCKVVINTITFI